MDEPTQCCCCSLCCGSKCFLMLQLYVGRALDAAKFLILCVKRSKKVPWQTNIKQIFQPNLTEEFKYVAFVQKENLMDVGKHRHKKLCSGLILCRHNRGIWEKLPTRRQLSQPRSLLVLSAFDKLVVSPAI